MASQRKKEMLKQEATYWRRWRRARRQESLNVLGLHYLANQIAASGSVIPKKS